MMSIQEECGIVGYVILVAIRAVKMVHKL